MSFSLTIENVWVILANLLIVLNHAYGSITNCGMATGKVNGKANLTCNTVPAYKISWGVRVGNDPVPILMVVDSSGSNYDGQINRTSYFGRLAFFGNITAGNTTFEMNSLNINDTGEFLWLVDPLAGGGFVKYYMFLNITEMYTKVINECIPNPCKNGGTCSADKVNGFNCTCAHGWEGRNCTKDINECASNPCKNEGSCIDLVNGFRCNCTSEWEGDYCTESKDINECDSNPCQNGGTCNDLNNGYSCTCASRWTGSHCDQNIIDCVPNPCKNGGTCQKLVNGFNCKCAPGWEGKDCSTSDHLSLAEIAGIVIGVLAVFFIIVIVIVVIVKKKKAKKNLGEQGSEMRNKPSSSEKAE